ncbi:MAG: hypothetical protein OEW64_03280 [Gammaproteobacteria bacterium]|nr:hypothetical protein [Gammaproteobacteria bacterium]MDH5322955.1 hypothetical protein [Gammaproteobacteria bacterium]
MTRISVLAPPLFAVVAAIADDRTTDTRQGLAPDIRGDETALKAQRGNLVAVPIPISNPTLDTGLIAGAAYFYPQSEEQMKQQPASLTAAAGMYTSNDSKAFAIAQQNYWKDDRWRFTGAFGAADLRLSLLAPDETGQGASVDWRINGTFLFTKLSRRIRGNWYGGAFVRAIDVNQSINTDISDDQADFEIDDVKSVGVGLVAEYDSRDLPLNSYAGRHLKIDVLFNDETFDSNQTYQSYSAVFRSYHRIADSLVLAFDSWFCQPSGSISASTTRDLKTAMRFTSQWVKLSRAGSPRLR